MKVYYNGFNLYRQLFNNSQKLIKSFEMFVHNANELEQIEVSYTYGVLLVATNTIHFYGGLLEENPKIFEFCKGNRILQIVANNKFFLVLFENGDLIKVCKDNLEKLITVPKFLNDDEGDQEKICRISIGSHISVAQTNYGRFYNIPNKLEFKNHDIIDVKTGREHCLLLDKHGNVYSFGNGSRGQLGHGTLEKELEPKLIEALGGIFIQTIKAGGWHSCALSKDGILYIWGWNSNGQLGIESEEFTVHATPQPISFGLNNEDCDVKHIACGERHTIALLDNGQLYGCGWNKYKQLLDSDVEMYRKMTYLFNIPKSEIVKELKCGSWNSFVICN